MADDTLRIDLTDDLTGHHLLVKRKGFTARLLIDVQSGDFGRICKAMARVIVGGDLPGGADEDALLDMPLDDLGTVVQAVSNAYTSPKAP